MSEKENKKEGSSQGNIIRERLYSKINVSLRTMDIVVAVVAIALITVFIIGVITAK